MSQGYANGGTIGGVGVAGNIAKFITATTVGDSKMTVPWADVKGFGALGDGSTDDTTAIQNAISSLSPGGIVWFPPGVYKVNATLTLTTTHIQLMGASKQDCTIKTASATNNVLDMNSWYCSVRHLTFDSSVTRTAGAYIRALGGNTRHNIDDCEFDNGFIGVQLQSHISSVTNCEFRTFVAGGSWIECSASASSAHDFLISGITGDNGTNAANTCGINLIQCASLLLSDCSLVHGGALGALYFNPGAGQVIPSVIANSVFFDNSGYGVQMAGNASGTIQRTIFQNCWFSSSTNDGCLINQTNTQGLMFVGCQFYGNGANGINAQAATEWQVNDSEFGGNVTTGIKTTAVSGMTFAIKDNFIGNVAGFGANGLGINIQSGTYSAYEIFGNRGLDTNTTPGITDSGSVTGFKQKLVDDNVGAGFRGMLAAIVADTAGINSTETIVVGGANILPIPANSLQIGDSFVIDLQGTCTSSAANASTFRVRLGTAGTTADGIILTGATAAAAITGTAIPFKATLQLTVRTLGAAATLVGKLVVINQGITGISTAAQPQVITLTPSTFNSTVNNYLECTYQAAAATTTCTFNTATVVKQ